MYATVRDRNRIDCFEEGLGRRRNERVFYVRTEANGDKKIGSSSSRVGGQEGRRETLKVHKKETETAGLRSFTDRTETETKKTRAGERGNDERRADET